MKKLALLLVIALCITLWGCPAAENNAPPMAKDVHITAGKIEPGMTVKDIPVEVTLDHRPIACRVQLTGFTATGYYEMAEDEKIPDPFYVRLDVFYSLPKGYDVDNINVTMTCDGGAYDGTGSMGDDDQGCVEAWSYAFYGQLPEETQPSEETQPETTPETTPEIQPHTHEWTEDTSKYIAPGCKNKGSKTLVCRCGETKKDSVKELGHDWKEPSVVPATCTKTGTETKVCKRCGEGLINELPATGHSWSDWVKETGSVHKRTCSCGAEETEKHSFLPGSLTCLGCGEDIVN